MMCAPYIVAIVFTNIVFLNIGAIIDPKEHNALFQIKFLSNLCAPGAVFDPEGPFFKFVTPLQIIISIKLNGLFRNVAIATTENENHRT